eukprot:11124405-Karenia_brevis.AAC.1
MKEVGELLQEDRVLAVKTNMCRFGMTSTDKFGKGLVQKATKFLTNSAFVAEELGRRCSNRWCREEEKHRHVQLVGGRARACQGNQETEPSEQGREILTWACGLENRE